jgi:hypothetical protein
MENGVEGGRPFRGGAANESPNEWRLLFAWKHHLIRFSIVRAIVGECQALSSDGKPAVAPIAELLVHGQVAGRCSARIKLSACAAICDVDGTVSVHTTAEHVLNSAQTFVVVHMTSHHEVDLPPAKKHKREQQRGTHRANAQHKEPVPRQSKLHVESVPWTRSERRPAKSVQLMFWPGKYR